ncbi:MAG: flagellar assembly peptidoglycan hydrolase FlgJ [Gammaproteobacteria bacterium]|nr:MAG: flagellar assembly peptidoglycan hydrolase FlgJ [Gammaproteobacteria bacterium]
MSLNALYNPSNSMSQSDVYTDLSGLQKLKVSARKDSQAAIPEVAKQFEAVMISMMIKNLRNTGMEDPIFNSQAMDSYRDMYDQQLGMELSKGEGIGFAKAIAEQIKYQSGKQQVNNSSEISEAEQLKMPQRRHFPDYYVPLASSADTIQSEPIQQNVPAGFNSPEEFVKNLWPLAEKTAKTLGVTPEVILSQAALETGWGKYVISKDNKSSYNLFNIKANDSWQGKSIEKVSMEYYQGKPVKQKSHFRAYSSYEKSFEDYANLIQNSPRYNSYLKDNSEKMHQPEQLLHDKAYMDGLQKAGYATDSSYSNKVLRVLSSDAIQNQIKIASK